MKTKPAHVVRSPDAAGRKACSKRKVVAAPARQCAPGFFTALVREHDWPPQFASSWSRDRQYGPQADASRALRESGRGHAGRPLGLPGSVPYISRPLNFGSLIKVRM